MKRSPNRGYSLPILACALALAADVGAQSLPGFSQTQAEGAGGSIANIDGIGKLDVVHGIYNAGTFHYRICFDAIDGAYPSRLSPVQSTSIFQPVKQFGGMGAGLEVGNIGGGTRPDIVLAICPYAGTTTAASIYYAIGYDLDVNGRAASWRGPLSAGQICNRAQGIGCTMGDLNGNGRPELLIAVYDNPVGQNTFRYRIGWDIDALGAPRTWSTHAVGGMSYEAHGASAVLTHLDGDVYPELILAIQDNAIGADTFRFRIGWDVGPDGNAKRWESTRYVWCRDEPAFGMACFVRPSAHNLAELVLGSAHNRTDDPEFAGIVLDCTATQAMLPMRYRIVADVHCAMTTEDGWNDEDEFYVWSTEHFDSLLTKKRHSKTARIASSYADDIGIKKGMTIPNLVMWEGSLYPGDNTELFLALMEDDDAFRNAWRSLPPGPPATSVEGTLAQQAANLITAAVNAADSNGDQLLGVLAAGLTNDNGQVLAAIRTMDKGVLRVSQFDPSLSHLELVDPSRLDGYRYYLNNLRLEQFSGEVYPVFSTETIVANLHNKNPGKLYDAVCCARDDDWHQAADRLLEIEDGDSASGLQAFLVAHLPEALRVAAARFGYQLHIADVVGHYDANRGVFYIDGAEQARTREIIDQMILYNANYPQLFGYAFSECLEAIRDQDWDDAVFWALEIVRRFQREPRWHDAHRVLMRNMPYALRYLSSRTANGPAAVYDPLLATPFRSVLADPKRR